MIVDTSALFAILRDEPRGRDLRLVLAAAQAPRISGSPNYLETAIVIDTGRDPIASRHVDDLFTRAGLVTESVTRPAGRQRS